MTVRINLAPPETRRRPAFTLKPRLPEFNVGLGFGLVYLVGLVLLVVYYGTLSRQESRLSTELLRANGELLAMKTTLGQGARVREQLGDLRERLDAIQELTKNQARPTALFDVLADAVPRDLWLTGLEDKSSELKLSGTAFSATAVADFLSNLRSSGRFKDVDLLSSKQDLTKNPRLVTFEAACRFGG
ncbi:MAG: PilN domain-containing protein [Candidatus Rokubacteria bacterium]|nr:PilN domain-containing protein [Candidatus Rokubacteria bacterium]